MNQPITKNLHMLSNENLKARFDKERAAYIEAKKLAIKLLALKKEK